MPEVTEVQIRPEAPADAPGIRRVNRAAFETDAEARLVDALRACDAYIPDLSLVAVMGGSIVGHLMVTHAAIEASEGGTPTLALAPMAVVPQHQRCGIGSALVRRALDDASRQGHEIMIVLGHPAYYPRFGFVPASAFGITSPFDAPDEAFMVAWLGEAQPRRVNGCVRYAEPFAAIDAE